MSCIISAYQILAKKYIPNDFLIRIPTTGTPSQLQSSCPSVSGE